MEEWYSDVQNEVQNELLSYSHQQGVPVDERSDPTMVNLLNEDTICQKILFCGVITHPSRPRALNSGGCEISPKHDGDTGTTGTLILGPCDTSYRFNSMIFEMSAPVERVVLHKSTSIERSPQNIGNWVEVK